MGSRTPYANNSTEFVDFLISRVPSAAKFYQKLKSLQIDSKEIVEDVRTKILHAVRKIFICWNILNQRLIGKLSDIRD